MPQTLMQPLAIVEPLDKRKDLPARLVPGVIRLMMHEFIFQGAKEAFRHAKEKGDILLYFLM
jgi:hypothetical protein